MNRKRHTYLLDLLDGIRMVIQFRDDQSVTSQINVEVIFDDWTGDGTQNSRRRQADQSREGPVAGKDKCRLIEYEYIYF